MLGSRVHFTNNDNVVIYGDLEFLANGIATIRDNDGNYHYIPEQYIWLV